MLPHAAVSVGEVTLVGSVVGVVTPVLSAILIVLVKRYLPQWIAEPIEKAVNETEANIKEELQNGVKHRLDEIHAEVTTESGMKISEEPQAVSTTIPEQPKGFEPPGTEQGKE